MEFKELLVRLFGGRDRYFRYESRREIHTRFHVCLDDRCELRNPTHTGLRLRIYSKNHILTMKGPRQREASQPATDPNLRPPAEKGENII